MKKPKICLVEPCDNHAEDILPQIDLLHDDYDVHVIAPQSLLETDLISKTKCSYEGIPVAWNQWDPRWRRLLRMPGKYRDIRHIVDSIRPEAVVFNSTYRMLDLWLIAHYFKGIRKTQIIHNFQDFLRPGVGRFYKEFDLNMVVSDEVHGYIVKTHPEHRSLDYFLPIFFDSFQPPSNDVGGTPADADGRIHFGVFGSIDDQRRNYSGLIESLAAWRRGGRKADFVVHLSGTIPEHFRKVVAKNDLGDMVRYYENYVSYEEMFRVLRNVDIVLFLIDAAVPNCNVYNRYKVSGTSTLVKGFHKVCAASRNFHIDAVLADKCFYYDGSHVEQLFENVENGSINKAVVREMQARYAAASVLHRDYQKARLLDALKRIGA